MRLMADAIATGSELMWGGHGLHPTYACGCWVSLRCTQPTAVDVGFHCVAPNLRLHPTYACTQPTDSYYGQLLSSRYPP
ncbi:MAG: hypothetical protein KFF72_17090 [Arthrospira sp. SH-MAG29]|nr:hypothetical protein [Arthrospira sp. SH-MAG29]MBS0018037.1 hypothetical protein [Arthrospira sp. SH-MAG29]